MTSPASPAAPAVWIHPWPARCHRPGLGVFVLLLGADLLWQAFAPPERRGSVPSAVVVWWAAVATLSLGLSRRLPLQNVVTVMFLAGGLGAAVDLLNAATDIPFGRRTAQAGAGPGWAGVGLGQPAVWIAWALVARGVARLILRPWRKLTYYGLWVMAVATGIAVGLAGVWEPLADVRGWWRRETPDGAWTWYATPLVAFLGWALGTLVIYGFTTPWMLNKQPVKQPTDWHPLIVAELLLVWMTASLVRQESWWAAGLGVVVGVSLAVVAVRGGRW